jgi:SAM-dependent methyltransferase
MELTVGENDNVSEPARPCRACGNDQHNMTYLGREALLGLGDTFDYIECSGCGAIQIAVIPEDLGKYYTGEYYTFRDPPRGWAKGLLKRARARYAFTGTGLPGRILVARYGRPLIISWLRDWISHTGLTPDHEILDVGCGNAQHFPDLMDVGYCHLTGIDPFVESDFDYGPGTKVLKGDMSRLSGPFDFVMLHHSFEHMPDPRHAMKELFRLVRPGGYVLIRTPVAGSYAWRTYRTNWVQLDPPRHLFVPSVRSLRALAEEVGFAVTDIVFDSDEFQFWGSEQCKRSIPLFDPRSYYVNPRASLFSRKEIREFRTRAEQLNRDRDGDSAAFYLRRPG